MLRREGQFKLNKYQYQCIFQLAHPILDSLKDTDKQWVVDLLFAFNSGNIAGFETLKTSWATQVGAQFLDTCVEYVQMICPPVIYSSPSILQPSILRPPLIIRPLDLVSKAIFCVKLPYVNTTCNIRLQIIGPMGPGWS